jgi:hypothetical protein
MRRFFLLLFAAASINALAADTAVKGYLVDVACYARIKQKHGSPANHSKSCLTAPNCADSGFGVLTDDKQFIKFDQDGNEKARKFVTGMDKETGIRVTVTGSVNSDTMTVSRIELQ